MSKTLIVAEIQNGALREATLELVAMARGAGGDVVHRVAALLCVLAATAAAEDPWWVLIDNGGDAYLLRSDGKARVAKAPLKVPEYRVLSPDRKRWAWAGFDERHRRNIYISDLDGGNVRQLTKSAPPAIVAHSS